MQRFTATARRIQNTNEVYESMLKLPRIEVPSLNVRRLKALIVRLTGRAKPRAADRRKDRKRALEWHRLSLRGVYTERRRRIRREEDRARCKYDPWYTFYEFNPAMQQSQSGSS